MPKAMPIRDSCLRDLTDMFDWYLHLSVLHRAMLFLLVIAFIVVMNGSFLHLSCGRYSWYRGVHSTPIFQFVMWIGALPLVIPIIYLYVRRKRALKSAKFIGNLRSRIYHWPECEYQRKISSSFFRYPLESAAMAENMGFCPCRVCCPH